METGKLLDLLNKERDYHTTHPNDVYVKTLTAIGTSLAAVVTSVYFSGKVVKTVLQELPITLTLVLFGLGLLLILVGLAEHSYLHGQHRKKIEEAIADIYINMDGLNFISFWDDHKSHTLTLFFNIPLKNKTPLITNEPDTRGYWFFHDRKFDVGGILIFTAYAITIYVALVK